MKVRNTAISALALGLALAAGSASAATVSSTFEVSATVAGSCVISAADNIVFGTYDPVNVHASAPLDATGRVAVRCTAGTPNVSVALDAGLNAPSSSTAEVPARRMSSVDSAQQIRYSIYQDAGRTQTWGGGSAQLTMGEFTSSLDDVELVTYGRIVGGQNVSVGTYTDTVGVTVTF